MIIDIYVGDPSNDGHGQSDRFVLDVPNYSHADDLEADFERGLEILGVESISQYARNYEQNEFPVELLERLGLTEGEALDDYEYWIEEGFTEVAISPEEYLLLWTTIVKLANPNFRYTEITGKNVYI